MLALAALSAPALAAPALWEISDADSQVYLFGSVHVLPPDIDWQTPLLTQTIAEAHKVYFEADIGFFAQLWATYTLVTTGGNFARTPWTADLDADQRAALAEALAPLGMTIEQAETYKPWVVSLLLEGHSLSSDNVGLRSGVEETILRDLSGDRVGYFETASQQIKLFSSASEEDQIGMLVAELAQPQGSGALSDPMLDAWLAGDDEKLLGEFGASLPSGEESAFIDTILYDRNRNWIAPIEKMLAGNEQNLIVVGAAHLLGNKGVVALLRNAGYAVRRVQ